MATRKRKSTSTPPQTPPDPVPVPVPPGLWYTCGIYLEDGPDGEPVPTHPLGDRHAQRILTGEISLEQAQADERRRVEARQLMFRTMRR